MKKKKVSIPIFKGELVFIKDKNFKKVNKKYGYSIPESYGAVTFENESAKAFEYVVCFVDTNISLLAHEAVHVSNFVFKNIGVKLDLINDEVQAYFVGWIVDEMINFLNEK